MSSVEELEKVSAGLADCMDDLQAFMGPFTQKMLAITDDPEGRQAVMSVLASALLTPPFMALPSRDRVKFLDLAELKVSQLREAIAHFPAVN